jgi:hypothetical protein
MVLSSSDGTLLLLQVICNFRKVIREYISSLYLPSTAVLENCKNYLSKWQQNVLQMFKGSFDQIPTGFDRGLFFLDDSLSYERITIYEGNHHTRDVTGEYILTMINPSRVLSFSMFIDPIAGLNEHLAYDQIVELCFIASLHSNPFWFEHILTKLSSKHKDGRDGFTFGKHPFYDWVEHTLSTFGGYWQGGPYNRWSPCGGSISVLDVFAGKQKGVVQNYEQGSHRLEMVIQELYHYLQWVNSLRIERGQDSKNVPIEVVSSRCQRTVQNIFQIVPCQFSTFRLSVFTTIAIGCGLLVPGSHLKALSVPAKKTGSYKHLQEFYKHSPNNTSVKGTVDVSQLDAMMYQLSKGLCRATYARDEMECLLCESYPSRRKDCRDWFKKGGRLYDCNENGDILVREYGKNSKWMPIELIPIRRKMAFIEQTPMFIQFNGQLEHLSKLFGERLRKDNAEFKYAGRNSKNSGNIQHYQNEYSKGLPKQFQYLQHRVAYFHHDVYSANMETNRSQVLGNGETSIDLETSSNRLSAVKEGLQLWKYSLSLVFGDEQHRKLFNAEYLQHQPGKNGCLGEVFHGHLDKAFATTVVFVPLTSKAFYALIAFPVCWNVQKDRNSSYTFQRWVSSLEGDDQKAVQKIQAQFIVDAEKVMKTEVDLNVYECSAGSILSFPASICYHMTITPQDYVANSYQVTPRDLFIIYPTTSGD